MSLNLINETDHENVEFLDIYDCILEYANSYLLRVDGAHGPRWKIKLTGNSVAHTLDELVLMNEELASISIKRLNKRGNKNQYTDSGVTEFHYLYTRDELRAAADHLVGLGVLRGLPDGRYAAVEFNSRTDLDDRYCGHCGRRIEGNVTGLPKRDGGFVHTTCAKQFDIESVQTKTVEHLRNLLHDGGDSLFQSAHKAGFSERAEPTGEDVAEIVDEAFWSADR